MKEEKVGIIDLGSNSARMSVYSILGDGGYELVAKEKRMVRLSEGMAKNKTLALDAIERTIEVLCEFNIMAKSLKVDTMFPTATAAVRYAKNQDAFLKGARDKAGIDFRVLSGEEEAYYDYLGVINSLDLTNFIMLDTGGGSCEFVLVINKRATHMASLPIGSVAMTEQFLEKELISSHSFFRLANHINDCFRSIAWLYKAKNLPLIVLGGSNRAIAKVHKAFSKSVFDGLHGYSMNKANVDFVVETMLKSNLEQRRDMQGINRERADIIVGGMATAAFLMRYIDSDRMIVSEKGLRDGLFFEYYDKIK